MPAFMMGGAKGIEPFVKKFRDGMMRVKYAQVPVVSAASGIALGGGCELMLHSARRVVSLETYIGLVEVGVAWCRPAAVSRKRRWRLRARRRPPAAPTCCSSSPTASRRRPWPKVSASALDARKIGYLQESDPVVFNVHELLHVALQQVRALADAGYHPPVAGAWCRWRAARASPPSRPRW